MTIDEIITKGRETDYDSIREMKREMLEKMSYEGQMVTVKVTFLTGDWILVRPSAIVIDNNYFWAYSRFSNACIADINGDNIGEIQVGERVIYSKEPKEDLELGPIMEWILGLAELDPKKIREKLAGKFREQFLKFGTTLAMVKTPSNAIADQMAVNSAVDLMQLIERYLPPIVR